MLVIHGLINILVYSFSFEEHVLVLSSNIRTTT